jgi:hypothetical protein
VRRHWYVIGGGMVMLMLLTACGGKDEPPNPRSGTPPAAAPQAGCAPAPAAAAQPAATPKYVGDPPGSPETQRIERTMAAVKLPANVTIFGRRDLTNEGEARDDAALLKRFTDAGRRTGAQYVLNVDGQQRISLGLNLYNSAETARKDFENLKPAPNAPKIDTGGLGDIAAGARVTLQSGGAQAFPINIVFARGCYVVTMADFAGSPDASPDTALNIARALDAQLKANPNP